MKQNIGTPAVVVVIILVVVIAGFLGYRALNPSGNAAPKPAGVDTANRYQQQYQNYNRQRPASGNPLSPSGGAVAPGGGRPGP